MSVQPRIARAFIRAIHMSGLSQADYAAKSGLSGSIITYMLKGRRPSPEVLRGLVMYWPNPEDGISVLVEHLRDEIDHAGGLHTKVNISDGQPGDISVRDALRELEQEAQISPSTRNLILDMAALLREFHARPYDLMVAEPSNKEPVHVQPAGKSLRYPKSKE